MTEKPKARLRPLKTEDIEIVASFERDIAKISFPDDPITDLGFYMKKVGKLIDDHNAATFGVDARVGRSEIDGQIGREKRQERAECQEYPPAVSN